MKKLLLFIPIIILISSCTITKRVHRPGYYISSNKNIKATKGKEETKAFIVDAKDDSTLVVNNKKTEKTEISINEKSYSHQNEKAEVQKVKTPVLKAKKKILKKHIYNTNNKTKPQEIKQKTNNRNKTTNPFGLASFILGLLGIFLLVIQIFAYFPFIIIAVLFAILTLIFAIVARVQQKKNPNKYKNNWMSIVGLVIGISGFAAALLVIGVFILFFIL